MGLFRGQVDKLKDDWKEGGKVAAQHKRIVAQEKADKRAGKSAGKIRLTGKGK